MKKAGIATALAFVALVGWGDDDTLKIDWQVTARVFTNSVTGKLVPTNSTVYLIDAAFTNEIEKAIGRRTLSTSTEGVICKASTTEQGGVNLNTATPQTGDYEAGVTNQMAVLFVDQQGDSDTVKVRQFYVTDSQEGWFYTGENGVDWPLSQLTFNGKQNTNPEWTEVPEPTSIALFALGALGLVAIRRRKRKDA